MLLYEYVAQCIALVNESDLSRSHLSLQFILLSTFPIILQGSTCRPLSSRLLGPDSDSVLKNPRVLSV